VGVWRGNEYGVGVVSLSLCLHFFGRKTNILFPSPGDTDSTKELVQVRSGLEFGDATQTNQAPTVQQSSKGQEFYEITDKLTIRQPKGKSAGSFWTFFESSFLSESEFTLRRRVIHQG
jgi:hypothetical protein